MSARFRNKEEIEAWFKEVLTIPENELLFNDDICSWFFESLKFMLDMHTEDLAVSEMRLENLGKALDRIAIIETNGAEQQARIDKLGDENTKLRADLNKYNQIEIGDLVVAVFCEQLYTGTVVEISNNGSYCLESETFAGPLYVSKYKTLVLKKKTNPIEELYTDTIKGGIHNVAEFAARLNTIFGK